MTHFTQLITRWTMLASLIITGLLVSTTSFADSHTMNGHVSKPFMGPKANTGFVTHAKQGNRHVLTLSDDFVVPDTPAPHWQVVDSKGQVFLLNRLKIKDNKYNKTITLPAYIHDVAKVQIWCAWAETLLGEAGFNQVQK